jgi:hypothetical protein
MAAAGSVTLAGRFPAGTHVRLVQVKDESVLRSEGGKLTATGKVKDDGTVSFRDGVEVGGRYFVVGYVDGVPREVRVRGNRAGEESAVLAQAPQGDARVRLADGSWADEVPDRESVPGAEVGPAPGQHQVRKGTPQRSETPRGYAHPVDTDEPTPYPRQEDVKKGTPQMSETETGRAAPIIEGAARQRDVAKGTPQRSDTELGVATVIPAGDAVQAQRERESSLAKAARGEPGRAAAEPLMPVRQAKQKAVADRDIAKANAETAKKATAGKVRKQVARKPRKK